MIQAERITMRGRKTSNGGDYVLYWMQAAQRVKDNPALALAVEQADHRGLPLLVCFGLTPAYPEANRRHYAFMLQGIAEVRTLLQEQGIGFVLRIGEPPEVAVSLAGRAALLVMDSDSLRHQLAWRDRVVETVTCPVAEVETEVVVPMSALPAKPQYAARTLRPKIQALLEAFLVAADCRPPRRAWSGALPEGERWRDYRELLDRLEVDASVTEVEDLRGGPAAALARLDQFVTERLGEYETRRNEPAQAGTSGLSPYLHFGQISPLTIALAAKQSGSSGADAFLEELIVRRELAKNYVRYNPAYDRYDGLPEWAQRTLADHAGDEREAVYSRAKLEGARTDDAYWNAAQRQMVRTGRMHTYMRMYWGKRILAWSRTPQQAFSTALYLNNKYELDGRDANAFTGVAWCFGLHDRPWQERAVFGKVRCMTAGGLERKFDMSAYLKQWPEAVDR